MILTAKGRYATMAVIDLAMQDSVNPVTLACIAERQDITVAYLEQIFAKLKAGKIVKSVRGPGGGYLLASSANNITIADIIMAVEEPIKMTRCGGGEHKKSGCMSDKAHCLTHHLWDGLGNHIYNYLNDITVEDVCCYNGELNNNNDLKEQKRI